MSTIRILRYLVVSVSLAILFSCDKDVSDVGGGVLTGTDISTQEFETTNIEIENSLLEAVQSNNLEGGYWLGTSKSEGFGDLNYGVLFRAEATISDTIASLNSTADNTFKIKSANLIIPYAYEIENIVEGEASLKIRDITNEGEPISVDVFRNDEYKLRLFSPDTNEDQIYFSNASDNNRVFRSQIGNPENSIFESVISNVPNTTDFTTNLLDEEGTAIDAKEISNNFERTNKFLQIALKKDFLGPDIVDADGIITNIDVISESSDFLKQFKGIYVQPKEDNNNIVRLFDNIFLNTSPRFENAIIALAPKIEIVVEVSSKENNVSEVDLTIDLRRQIINIVDFSSTQVFDNALSESETMIIKGGASVSEIKLFSNEAEFKALYDDQVIINQAVLRFKVNQSSPLFTNAEALPNTLFVNQSETGNVLTDYLSLSQQNALNEHLLPLDKEELTYDIDISQHVATILAQPNFSLAAALNNKLVIGLSDQIENSESLMLRKQNKRINIGNFQSLNEVPLYGNEANEDERPQLLIKFTPTK